MCWRRIKGFVDLAPAHQQKTQKEKTTRKHKKKKKKEKQTLGVDKFGP